MVEWCFFGLTLCKAVLDNLAECGAPRLPEYAFPCRGVTVL